MASLPGGRESDDVVINRQKTDTLLDNLPASDLCCKAAPDD